MQKKKISQNVRFFISQGGKILIADFTGTLQTKILFNKSSSTYLFQ